MKGLRNIRIFLSSLFFAGAVAFLVTGTRLHIVTSVVDKVQIVPSLLASGLGAILVWFALTFLFGRIYCSSVCPIGTLQDYVIPLRKYIKPLSKPFRYRPANRMRYHVLVVYAVCLVLGAVIVTVWIEPWDMMRNICGAIRPSAQEEFWLTLGVGMSTGIAAGVISAVLVVTCALLTGRGFCTDICPIGTALGCFHDYTLFHIEIDPDKCVNCMKCEEVCKSSCVKVIGRYVDNSRCVRCFDCLGVCPNDAIRFQVNRNRPATPLFRKVNRGAVK